MKLAYQGLRHQDSLFLANISDYTTINKAYGSLLPTLKLARTAVEVGKLLSNFFFPRLKLLQRFQICKSRVGRRNEDGHEMTQLDDTRRRSNKAQTKVAQ